MEGLLLLGNFIFGRNFVQCGKTSAINIIQINILTKVAKKYIADTLYPLSHSHLVYIYI